MRIDALRIENFRRFRLLELELADGVTALVGRNGAGKSTLLEAIGWCLFGHDAARTSKDLLKRRGAAPHEDVRVHLAFRFGGNVFEVTRELVGKSEQHTASVKVDGKVVVAAGAQSAKEATGYVERLFHMDRTAFFTSVVARQRELAALSDAKPAERKRILVGLLRLDAVDSAIVEARTRRRDARAELAGLRAAMQDVVALRAQRELAVKAVEAQTAVLVATEARIVALVDEVEDARGRRDSGRKFAEEHRLILSQAALVEQRLAHLADQMQRTSVTLAAALAARGEAATLVALVDALPAQRALVEVLLARSVQHQELVRLRAEIARADQEAAVAHADAQVASAALIGAAEARGLGAQLAAQRAPAEASLTAAQRRLAELETGARELAKQVNEVTGKEKRVRAIGPEAPCPSCTRPLREHYEELLRGFAGEGDVLRASLAHAAPAIEEARSAGAAATAALARLAAQEAALRLRLERLAADESRASAALARVGEAQQRAARLRAQEAVLAGAPFDAKELDAARSRARALETAASNHARLLAQADRAPELEGLLEELGRSNVLELAQRAALLARRDALAFDPLAHEALERSTHAAEGSLHAARLVRERAAGERARREDEERRLAEALAQQEELGVRAVALESRVRLLEELAGDRDGGLLPEFKDHLIDRIRPLLSLHAGRLFRELTEGRYADLELDEEYDLLVHDEGQAFPLARFSGGEADLANLCLRLAVSQVVADRAGSAGIGFLALDEIFGSQDEIRKANILRALATLSGRFRQILLITHIPDVKESADQVLRVEERDDGTSTVSAQA